jgi:glycolate oxidase FAD binding subunit
MRELQPSSLDEAAEAMTQAAREQQRVAFVGGGTELGVGGWRERADVVLRTGRMARILEYAPADMVIVAEAGVTLAQLQAETRARGQMLALDPPLPERATVGGLVATGAFGPRRARYGAVRDLVIGVTLVRADGAVARGGGKVVKNVAGFDLPKIACGSFGTLGLVATATFRLHPLPEVTAAAVAEGVAVERIPGLLASAREAQLEPSSVVALRSSGGGFDVGVWFEGFAKGAEQQVARFVDRSGAKRVADDGELRRRHDAARTGGPLRVRVGALPSRIAAVRAALAPLFAVLDGPEAAWYATVGIGFVAGAPRADWKDAVAASRARLAAEGGWLVVEAAPEAPDEAALELDPWGPPPPAFEIMRQLKQRFDPEHRLNAGRFVGGL